MVSPDEFTAWRDDPVTRQVFAALARAADACRETWLRHSWEGGQANPELLTELRARADAYAALQELQHEGLAEWLEQAG